MFQIYKKAVGAKKQSLAGGDDADDIHTNKNTPNSIKCLK
jgi:hypothetical protein